MILAGKNCFFAMWRPRFCKNMAAFDLMAYSLLLEVAL